MGASAAIGFWVMSLAFICIPGADWAYTISAGLRDRGLIPAISGLMAGHLVLLVTAGVSLTGTLALSPDVMSVIALAGAAYLAYLGIHTLRRPATVDVATGQLAALPGSQLMAKGAGVSMLNPAVLILLLAMLPQFADISAGTHWPVAAQVAVLGLLHLANCAMVYGALGLGVHKVLGKHPQATVILGRVSGAAMIVLGAVVAAKQLV